MTPMRTVTVGGLVDEVSTLFERIFDDVETLRGRVEALYARLSRGDGRPRPADLAELRPAIISNLGGERGLVVGSGYIAAPGALEQQQHWLEWWKSERDGRPVRLEVDLAPDSDSFLDYTRQAWYETPMRTGRREVTGPYVDYVCTDEYSLTFTVPAWHGESFIGVVGSDVYVTGLEPALLPALRALGARAALVNTQGRVIVSNTVAHVSGALIRTPHVAELWRRPESDALHRCGDFPVGLLVLPAN